MFERLTIRMGDKVFYNNDGNPLIPAEILDTQFVRQILNRLAAYEDSGLSPEEVQELANAKAERESAQYAIEAIGSEAKHIIDLLRAEAEGRLVVLPVKVGDTIYRIVSYKCNAVCNKLNACNSFVYKACKQPEFYICPGTFQFNDMEWIGKTVFLTREEAEKAIGGGQIE